MTEIWFDYISHKSISTRIAYSLPIISDFHEGMKDKKRSDNSLNELLLP